MNRSPLTSLALTLLLLVSGSALARPVHARQRQQPHAASISQVREQIRRMVAVELNEKTPPGARESNRNALRERRARLRELLRDRLDNLLASRAELKGLLTPDQEKTLVGSINETLAEIRALDAGDTAGPAPNSTRARRRAPAVIRASTVEPSAEPAEGEPELISEASSSAEALAAEVAAAQGEEGNGGLTIHAPKQITDAAAQVTITNSNRNIMTFALFKNGKPVADKELPSNDISVAQNAPSRDVHVKIEVGENSTAKIFAIGFTGDGDVVGRSKVHEIRRTTAAPAAGGNTQTSGRIEITKPKDKVVFADAESVEVRFKVKPPKAGTDEKTIERVFVGVLNKGIGVTQDSPEVKVKADGETVTRVKIGKGDNQIRLYSEWVEGKGPLDLTTRDITCEGDKCGQGGAAGTESSRIEITKPKNRTVYSNVGTVPVQFTVKAPETPEQASIPKVSFNVLNEGIGVDQGQPDPKVDVKTDGPTTVRVRVAKGVNRIQLFSGFNAETGRVVNPAEVTVICEGDECGSPISTVISNSQHMRAVVGIEQAGASSAKSESKPFLDFFFFGPLSYGKSCRGDAANPDNCVPTWSSWGNVRFSSVPQQISTFGTLASNFVSPLAEGRLTELVQGFNFMAGLDRHVYTTPKTFISPIPGVRHKTAIYLTAGYGAISPLDPRRSAQIFKIPGADNPQRAAFLKQYPMAEREGAQFIAFVPQERDQFLRQYFAGVRFKTFFLERDGVTYINRFPAVLDVTYGQSESVTGGRFRGGVFRIEAFYPFPIKEASFLYFYGSAFLKGSKKNKLIRTPFILTAADSDIQLTDDRVVITSEPLNRDFYRIGVGVNLTDLFNRRQPEQ